jgi:hypothetical protein
MEGQGHVAGGKLVMRRGKRPCGRVREGGAVTHGSKGKEEREVTRQGSGPHWLNMKRLRGAGLFKRC